MELPNVISIVGAILLVAGSTLFGRAYGKQYQERVEFLRDVQSRVDVLKNEILFFKGVLTDSFQRAAEAKGPAQDLFAMMQEALKEEVLEVEETWSFCCEKTFKQIYLTEEERTVIGTLGQLLGASDVEVQISNLETIGSQIQVLEKKAEEDRKKNQPLWQKIGPVAGAALAIVLL